jgi:hypothetical protein
MAVTLLLVIVEAAGVELPDQAGVSISSLTLSQENRSRVSTYRVDTVATLELRQGQDSMEILAMVGQVER